VRFDTIDVKDVAPDLFLRRLYGSGRDVSSMLAELGPLRIPDKLLEEARDRDGEGDEWEIVEDERHPEWHWRLLCEAVASVVGALSLQGEELPLLVRSRSVPEGLPLALHAFSLSQQYFVAKLYRAITATVIRLTDVCSEHGASAFETLHQMSTSSGFPVPNTADQMIVTASRVLNLTAAGCGPRLDLATPDGSPAPTNTTAPDLLSTLAAQMVAHVNAGAPAQRCAYPPAGAGSPSTRDALNMTDTAPGECATAQATAHAPQPSAPTGTDNEAPPCQMADPALFLRLPSEDGATVGARCRRATTACRGGPLGCGQFRHVGV
jgi:hypothetical protein